MAAAGETNSWHREARFRSLCRVAALLLLLVPGCAAPSNHRGACSGDIAPCGPACWPLAVRQWIVPQQFQGADFRPACRLHDRCYGHHAMDREACDDRFRDELLRACESSAFPGACRAVAGLMHGSVSICGGWFKLQDGGEGGREHLSLR